MDTRVWSQEPDFIKPRVEFPMANINGRSYAFPGKISTNAGLDEDFNCDTVVLKEDLSGWDVVPDLEFVPHFFLYAIIPYNL